MFSSVAPLRLRVKIFADIMADDGGWKTDDGKFSADEIARGLPTQMLGKRIVFYDRIGSTNDVAQQLAAAGEPEGTVIIAEEQTAGRGRLGRQWLAPPRSSILMSIILRPILAPHQVSRVTMAVALGACKAVRAETGLDAQIKWPNDLLVRGKKFAGILCESGIVGETLEYVIAGVGINVNFNTAVVEKILPDATTIADELGKASSRVRLTQAILREIEKYYLRVNEDLRAEYCQRLATLNHLVCAHTPTGMVEGVAQSVNENGALVVRRADGSHIELVAGDVTLIKSSGG